MPQEPSPNQEEIQKRREFAYRAYSPDSEPPPASKDTGKPDSAKKDVKPDLKKEKRQNA